MAAASGKLDGLATVGGVIVGGARSTPRWSRRSAPSPTPGSSATFTLPQLLHLPAPVVAALVVAIAVGAFVGAEKIERLVTGTAPRTPPVRRRVFVALGVLAAVAIVTLALPVPEPEF